MKLLLVEDDGKIAASLVRGLAAEGFTVTHVADGLEGLWYGREHHFDVIVLDLLLPGMNGFKVCDELRRGGVGTPILVLTAKEGELDEAEALDTGADDYLTKPFSFTVLVARLRALLRRGGPSRAGPLAAGDLRVDRLAHRCWRGEAEVLLTARELGVLGHLVARAGEVVTKEELLDAVWDHAFDGDPNIVEVYVGRLRRKVDEPFGRRAIETVRGAGYRIDPNGG